MSEKGYIYKIISPSGKVYIGESYNLEARLDSYKRNECKAQRRLYNSLIKHGWENHLFEIVEECEIDNMYCRERHWQDIYDVIGKNGLNCRLTECSENNKKRVNSEETKIKKSLAQMGVKNSRYGKPGTFLGKSHTKETKKVLSDIAKENNQGEDNPMFGKNHTEYSKNRISKNRIDNKVCALGNNPRAKLVLDLNTGIFYMCLKEACIALGLNYKYTQKKAKRGGSINQQYTT